MQLPTVTYLYVDHMPHAGGRSGSARHCGRIPAGREERAIPRSDRMHLPC